MYVKTVDYKAPQAAREFAQSLKETGFVVLSNHPISQVLIDTVYKDWEKFFKGDTKFDVPFDPHTTRQKGYFPFKSENAKGYSLKDLKEYYQYRDVEDTPPGMGLSTQTLFEELMTLGGDLLNWIEQALPDEIKDTLSMPLPQMIKDTDMSMIRIIHYPPLREDEEEGAVRSAAHEDINLITILPASAAPGLQVKDRKGAWHEVSCDYETVVINVGDMLEMVSQGFYKSTTHQVINPTGEAVRCSRYSLPLFFHPRNDVPLSSQYTAGEFLAERLGENGVIAINPSAP
jgi:isopenicillin N synthase-like dioxygenase